MLAHCEGKGRLDGGEGKRNGVCDVPGLGFGPSGKIGKGINMGDVTVRSTFGLRMEKKIKLRLVK